MGTSSAWNPAGLAHRRLSGDHSAAVRLAATVLLLIVSPYLHSPRGAASAGAGGRHATAVQAGVQVRREQACGRAAHRPEPGRFVTRCD